MPRIFSGKAARLGQAWMYNFHSALGQETPGAERGIGAHVDQSLVNVNLWLTPDAANLEHDNEQSSAHGGLRVCMTPPPKDWAADADPKFKSNTSRIRDHLTRKGQGSTRRFCLVLALE